MNKNLIASILKHVSVVLFCLSIIGGIALAQKEELVLKESDFSWEEDEYVSENAFDGAILFTTLFSSAVSCSLIYGLGELIQIQYNNGLMLYSIAERDKEKEEESE